MVFIINVNLQNNQNRRMRSFLIALFALVAVANAEKYAMVFGAAHGWNNYPVYSVSSCVWVLFIVNMPYSG